MIATAALAALATIILILRRAGLPVVSLIV
jgi:hypothetical protein